MIELVGGMMMTNEQLAKVKFAFIFSYLDFKKSLMFIFSHSLIASHPLFLEC